MTFIFKEMLFLPAIIDNYNRLEPERGVCIAYKIFGKSKKITDFKV